MKIKYFDKNHKKIDSDFIIGKIVLPSIAFGFFAIMVTVSLYGNSNPIYNGKFDQTMEQTFYIVDESQYSLDEIYLLYNDKEIRKCIKKAIKVDEYNRLKIDYSNLAFKNLSGYYPVRPESITEYYYEFYDISTNEIIATTNFDAESSESHLTEYGEEPEATMNGYKYIKLNNIIKEDFQKNKNEDYLNIINNDFIDDLVNEYHHRNK